jgi:hypothetical protein
MLEGRLKRAQSTLIDLQISQDRFNQAVIVAGDDFTDSTRVDATQPLQLPRADLQALAHLLTLKRTSNKSPINPDQVTIQVDPLQNYPTLYEGQFYGLVNQWVPEGGEFHLAERPAGQLKNIPTDLIRRFREYVVSQPQTGGRPQTSSPTQVIIQGLQQARQAGQFAGFTISEWELLSGHIHSGTELTAVLGGIRPFARAATNPSLEIVDEGPSAAIRLEARRTMLDGDPATFWQVEYTYDIPSVSKDVTSGDENHPERVGALSEYLVQSSRNFDITDFDVRLTLTLPEVVNLNWIDLIPMLFEGIEHLEVLAAQTSVDGVDWETIPTLRSGSSGNAIARNTNDSLTPLEAKSILSPSASAFGGKGLWVFPTRSVKYVRFDLRQPVPVITPYQRAALMLSSTVTRHHSKNVFGKSRKPPSSSTESRTVILSYPETILAVSGGADPAELSKTGDASRTIRDEKIAGLRGLSPADALIFGVGGGAIVGGRTTYGAETITKQWFETYWDKARYAIAIRDIGLWAYTYEVSSELISVPFQSPEPIRDISLEVDELIPPAFTEGRELQRWIEYYVAVGDSTDWVAIAPVNSRAVRPLEGGQTPVVLHVNSGIPPAERNPAEGYLDLDHDVQTVRFRAILRRPTDVDRADELTPVLKSYRLILTVRGGFR